ncbi:MAG: rhodanese [Betaproteobacteria bacterium TMED41]|nr:MAG: rhodanese [Betaproteobacteria bacterium TMED41]|tara:strand:+ start:597 stop:971 length:375 start_codon:yes stop_codon:yes gene_type:complete
MKTAKSALDAANKVVPKIDVNNAIAKHSEGKAVFVDVRDGIEISETGTIKNALRIPRGFIEFAADSETPFHNKALKKDTEIILVCAAGGMAALTGHTLIEMGYQNVSNAGGFSDWKNAKGPIEE